MPGAARVGDDHTCPAYTGTVAHVGGPILGPGATTVLIEGLAASIVGDECECTGAVDSTVAGSGTVMFEGSPAVRLGDATEHGGEIVAGSATVIVGD